MGKWYLTIDGAAPREFSKWVPAGLSKTLEDAGRDGITFPRAEPATAIVADGWAVLPLVDDGPDIGPGQMVTGREVVVSEGAATAVYTVEDKPAAQLAAELAEALTDKLAAIDAEAERQRGRHVSPLWGQEQVYLYKEGEAAALTADPETPEADTPYLTAEAEATGAPRANLAAEVSANSAAWRALSVGIEARRMGLKGAARAAATVEDLAAIDIATGWPG